MNPSILVLCPALARCHLRGESAVPRSGLRPSAPNATGGKVCIYSIPNSFSQPQSSGRWEWQELLTKNQMLSQDPTEFSHVILCMQNMAPDISSFLPAKVREYCVASPIKPSCRITSSCCLLPWLSCRWRPLSVRARRSWKV